jgi:hypothetical protein
MAEIPDVDRGSRHVRSGPLLYAAGAWVGMVVLAIFNATLREVLITPTYGEYAGHVISTATLLVLLAGYVFVYFRRRPVHTGRELALVGVLWAGLTVAFEFLFGHYVAGQAWGDLLALYDVTQGNIWVVVPLFILVAPTLLGRYQS